MPLSLPDRASLEFLKKLSKERLALLRLRNPESRLADAQLAIARDYGFRSWRALKAEVDSRRAPNVAEFIRACRAGDVEALRGLLGKDPGLARERVAGGATGLHLAARSADSVRLLIDHGADPDARDLGDNATPLHVAAANRALDSVRALLDAGADVHGSGDLHDGGVIGWASFKGNEGVISLLLQRGARHHIFSAMALRDCALVEALVEDDPECLHRRRSRFENRQTPLHASFAPADGLGFLSGAPDYPMLELLIRLGADLESPDDKGRTPLMVALLRGDRDAMKLLRAAGAEEPEPVPPTAAAGIAAAASVLKSEPLFSVADMRATVAWYESVGFTVKDRYEDGGSLMFAKVAFGNAEFALSPGGDPGPRGVSLWFFTERVHDLYQLFKARQLDATRPDAPGSKPGLEIRFDEDLYAPFYGGRQFSIRDVNGLTLIFWQPPWLSPGEPS